MIPANIGFKINDIHHVTPREALELCKKGAVLVDMREDYATAYKAFNVDNYVLLPMSKLPNQYSTVPENELLIVADSVGLYSKPATQFFMEKGYKHVVNLAGGILEWERDGLPLKIDKKERLTGSCVCQLKKRHKK